MLFYKQPWVGVMSTGSVRMAMDRKANGKLCGLVHCLRIARKRGGLRSNG